MTLGEKWLDRVELLGLKVPNNDTPIAIRVALDIVEEAIAGHPNVELRNLLVDLAVLTNPDVIERFDVLAEKFYRATGVMAPGKSVAPEMANGQPPDDVRASRYREWFEDHRAALHARIVAALTVKP